MNPHEWHNKKLGEMLKDMTRKNVIRHKKTMDGVVVDVSDQQMRWLRDLSTGMALRKDIEVYYERGRKKFALQRLGGLVTQGLAEETARGWKITVKGKRFLRLIEE